MARHGTGSVVASALVLAATAGFVAYTAAAVHGDTGGTRFRASFVSGQGLAPGAPVVLAGVPVGTVRSVTLDVTTMTAVVAFTTRSRLTIPSDSALTVAAAGPTGGDVLVLEPGSSPAPLAAGTLITRTTPATTLESQVGDYIFGAGIGGSK